MKIRCLLSVFAISMAGCASTPLHSKAAPTPPTQTNPSPATPSMIRVTLPYTYTRHGVEIRVTSIEFAGSQVLVNATLQETRGNATDLTAPALMQMLRADGSALSYVQYSRAEKIQADPAIHVAAHDQFSVTLYYQPAAGSSESRGSALELRFPTGKYWSSQAAD